MARPHRLIVPSLLILLLELSALTIHISAQIDQPTRLALPSDNATTTDYTGQIRSFSEFGGGLNTDPPALVCYTNGNFQANMSNPDGIPVVSSRQNPGPTATDSQLFISSWDEDAIILHRGPQYFSPDGEYCCHGNAYPNIRRCLTLTSCQVLTPVTNGMITYNRNTNQATYSCNTGYSLSGTSPITCNEGTPGSWSAAQPTCQLTCPNLTPLANGNPVTYSDNTPPRPTGATATYSCVSGYQLTGNTMRSCTASGWDGSDPVCTAICNELTLTNGIVTYNPTSSPRLEGTVATHSCDTGYMLSDRIMRICQNNRMWSGQVICQLTCPDFPLPASGNITYSDNTLPRPSGATATYSCVTGYEVSGNTVRTCTAGGWDGRDTTCTPVDCGSPPVVTNGIRTFTATTFKQTAIYSCNTGYQLSGSTAVTCQDDRSWSTPPACSPITCSSLSHGSVTYSTNTSPYPFNTTATYNLTCPEGMRTVGDTVRVCTGDRNSIMGVWNGTIPVCAGQSVFLSLQESVYAINNSRIPVTKIGSSDDDSLICHTNLTSCCRGLDRAKGGRGMGIWQFPDGRNIPKASHNGSGFYWRRFHQFIRLYQPDEGVQAPLGSYCCVIPDSTWDSMTLCANLVAAVCPELTLTNGMVTYNTTSSPRGGGTVATHSCDTGYMLSGGTMRTRQNNSMWSGGVITCQLACPDLTPPATGQIVTYSAPIPRPPSATATYSCITGYEVSGNTVRTCTAGGWDGIDPTCTSVHCGSPPVVTNGIRTFTATTFQQTATYSCNTGYQLSTSATVTCQADRSWSTPPSCPPVDCGTLTVDNGQVSTPSGTTYLNTATYSCDPGYTLNGPTLSTCAAHVQWSPLPPTCDPVDCGPLTSLLNGVVDTSSGTTFMSVATYSCAEGHILSGFVNRVCQADGTWSLEAPVCSLISLSAGMIAFPVNNSVVAISLIREGSSALTCRTELSSCCRDADNPSGEALGQWVEPNGSVIPENSDSGFYVSRHTSSISLSLAEGSSGQGGSYCCILPRAGGVTLTTCVLVEVPEISNPPPSRQSVQHFIIALVVIGVILVITIAVIVMLVISLIMTARQLRNARTQIGRVDSQTDNVVYEDPTLTHYEEVDRKPAVGGAGPSAIELNQCPAYQVSGQYGRREELIYDN